MSVGVVKSYMVLLLVLGVIALTASIFMLNEGMVAISIPLLIVSSTSLMGLRNGSAVVFYRYLIYGLVISVVLELVSYAVFATITGKAVSMGLSLGLVIYLVYEAYSRYRKSRKHPRLEGFKEVGEKRSREEATGSSGEGKE